MSVLQIAGKNPNSLAKGVLVETDGEIITTKKWKTEQLTVLENESVTTTEAFSNLTNAIDLSEYGIVSLRIEYIMPGADVAVNLYSDLSSGTTTWMYDENGTATSFVLPATSIAKVIIITPDDFKYLSYLKYLKVRVQPNSIPTSAGLIRIYAIVKR